MAMKTLMGEQINPQLYLAGEQLSNLGDVGPVGTEREIHCTVRVSEEDGDTATLEVIEIAFMENGDEEEAEADDSAVADRMYPTMKG